MLTHIAELLTPEQAAQCRLALEAADWSNALELGPALQLPDDHPVAQQLTDTVLRVLQANAYFMSAVLPTKIFPPRFVDGGGSGTRTFQSDNAVLAVPDRPIYVRSDLAAVLFLSPPGSYDGGDLVLDGPYGTQAAKLPAGDLAVFESSLSSRVEPVLSGRRLACTFRIQSMVRHATHRMRLLDLDMAIHQLGQAAPDHPALNSLANLYHNLLREWAEV